ncbi:hypothetical protein PIB30_083337 [Stylosanthes scabra]|uniref:Uncharacterized protein n=1 Tax=Stylosanthes scabra TaxID=79078 RepID=A0ABU6UT03_9FABA|nr:hypothetical protein [Stylosanthes scabra]
MKDLSMFQRPRTVALEDENLGTYGTVLIYPLYRLVEYGFVGDTAVNPWVGIFCRRQGFARERYTPWNPTPYQPHDLEYNAYAYQSNGLGDAYYGYEDPSPQYPPSQNGMDELFEALAQERKEIREVQGKMEIQLDLLIKLVTLVFEHLNNSSTISQPSDSENLPSQRLSNPWGHIATLFPCTNQEGREDALLNEEDVKSLHECLEEVEE